MSWCSTTTYDRGIDTLDVKGFYRSSHGLELEEVVGQGGFGRVYRAKHLRLDVTVAVKVLLPGMPAVTRKLFAREARLMARVDHPNVLRVFDYAEGPEGPYIVTEWMAAGSVSSPVDTPESLRDIGIALASALDALHQAGVVHRDVKPDNLLRHDTGRHKLGDLGIAFDSAKTAGGTDLVGTLPYMAPELFSNTPSYGPATDSYALGITLYQLWAGACPFTADSVPALIHKISCTDAPPLGARREGLPTRVYQLVDELLARDPSQRPPPSEVVARLVDDNKPPRPDEQATTSPTLWSLGPWLVTNRYYASSNWQRFLVHHRETGQTARLSQLQSSSRLNGELILESARNACHWDHPGITPVLDWGTAAGQPFVVFGSTGSPIDGRVRAHGPLEEAAALAVAHQVASALAYLHDAGFVYQMVEPGSVYESASSEGVTLGWPCFCSPIGGDATSRRVYVPAYAPPPFLLGDRFNAETDVYGIGVVLWFLLTGQPASSLTSEPDMSAALERALPMVTAPTRELVRDLLDVTSPTRLTTAHAVSERCARIRTRLVPTRAPMC